MSQDQAAVLAFKIVLVAGVLSVAAFIVLYHRLTDGAVWRDEVGKTIVVKDVLLILMLLPAILSLFFRFSGFTSHIAAWTDVVLFGLLTPVMTWRCLIWARLHRDGRNPGRDAERDREGAEH